MGSTPSAFSDGRVPDLIHTSTSTQSDAAHNVLYSYELLENILHQLPQKELLICQGVNTYFKGVITRSLRLQKALFFVQGVIDETDNLAKTDDSPVENKMLLDFLSMRLYTWNFAEKPGSWRYMFVGHNISPTSRISWRSAKGNTIHVDVDSTLRASEMGRIVEDRGKAYQVWLEGRKNAADVIRELIDESVHSQEDEHCECETMDDRVAWDYKFMTSELERQGYGLFEGEEESEDPSKRFDPFKDQP